MILTVNCERFQRLFPPKDRYRVAEFVAQAIKGQPDFTQRFFGQMQDYHHLPFYVPEMSISDLFSPNICVIDFALSHLDPKSDLILDWGCGLGTCSQYLQQQGFSAVGYDNWKQVARSIAERFQAKFPRSVRFLASHQDVEPTVVSFVSIWCLDREAYDRSSVKWILADSHYAENTFNAPWAFDTTIPPGFEFFGEYPRYLKIYRRIA